MSVSFCQSLQLVCHQCARSFPFDLWLIIDLVERPDLTERLRAGTLHTVSCPHCGYLGQVDAPLLLYRPGEEPPLLFSPAEQTPAEQDREHAAELLTRLQASLGDAWQDAWLAEGLPGIPRYLLLLLLDSDADPEALLEQMAAQAAQELERLREEDPERFAELEATARQMLESAGEGAGERGREGAGERGREGERAQGREGEDLADKLIAWIQTPDWQKAEDYLQTWAAELLTDEAEAELERLRSIASNVASIPEDQALLRRARKVGIAAMYAESRQKRLLQALQQGEAGPIGAAVWRFVQADDAQAAALLQTESALLLSLDASDLLRQLAEAAQAAGDADFAARVAARLEQQQAAYYARVGGPKRTAPAEVEAHQAQPESWQERVERHPVQAERGSTYTVISASQCAIGDNAMVINNIGRLPLRWKRPAEGRPLLARAAVGRETELAELHGRLTSTRGVALVARGTSAAVRGQSGIGKTTLAAMYAERYGAQYPGGVLWLDVGPGRRTPDLVAPILQRIATYAYDADLQANALLENAEFAADAVKALLDGHGALLVIIDDVWSTAALDALREALPEDACTLLTTRDYDVAYALENSPAAIQTLDVLAPPDARLLLQQGAPGLPDDLADTVARGLGYHAQALTLAAGALASRKPHNYARTAAELLRRVAAGEGFGDLPRLDKTDQVTAVEIALKYSYDYLGESSPPAPAQFRALGAFAPEADFDLAAVAAMWNLDAALAEEFLLLLDGLGLLQETVPGARWQQHVILRAYALSLQTAGERIQFSERHADHYIALAQACYESKPRKYDRVEQEFLQIQHAFDWCQENSPRRATRLALLLDDFMRNRGRAATLHQWLQTAMQGADLHGDRLGKANTLQSLGDLESRLGHLEQARAHYDAALPLYEAEQDRLGKANTLQSLGDLESRLGHLEQARAHYDAALPLYEAEQEPTGKLNTWISLARLEAALGRQAEADHYYQRAFRLAEDIGFGDHPVVRDWKEEYARFTAGQTGQPPMDEASVMQQIADLLIVWIQTPDWSASEAFVQEHAADLLTDEAEAVLERLRQGNPDHRAIPQHQTLLRRCRDVGIEAAYRKLKNS